MHAGRTEADVPALRAGDAVRECEGRASTHGGRVLFWPGVGVQEGIEADGPRFPLVAAIGLGFLEGHPELLAPADGVHQIGLVPEEQVVARLEARFVVLRESLFPFPLRDQVECRAVPQKHVVGNVGVPWVPLVLPEVDGGGALLEDVVVDAAPAGAAAAEVDARSAVAEVVAVDEVVAAVALARAGSGRALTRDDDSAEVK